MTSWREKEKLVVFGRQDAEGEWGRSWRPIEKLEIDSVVFGRPVAEGDWVKSWPEKGKLVVRETLGQWNQVNGIPSQEQAHALKALDVTIRALAADVLGVTLVNDLTGDRHLVISNLAALGKSHQCNCAHSNQAEMQSVVVVEGTQHKITEDEGEHCSERFLPEENRP